MTLLAARGLTKRFSGLTAVNEVSFEVQAGSITALIGPNGAGKTTCFNMVAGMIPPTSGAVLYEGRDVTGVPPESICAQGIARTFQIVRPLAHMSVLDNVMVGALHRRHDIAAARRHALEVLERVGLAGRAASAAADITLPDRKMLELARALATGPRLLLLDEVMAGLRPSEADRIAQVLRELAAGGMTVFLIEHVMRVVMALAERVIVLHHGELIAEGPPAQVAADARVIESYLGRRTGAAAR